CMMSGSRAMRPLIGRSGPSARDTSSPTCRRPEYFIIAAADYDKTGRLPSSPNARWPISGLCTNTRGANGQSLSIGYSGCRPGGLPFDGGMTVRRCAGLARRWPRGRVSTVDSVKKTDARSSYWTTQPAWLRRRYGSLFVQFVSEGRSATQATHEMVLLFQGQTIGGRVGCVVLADQTEMGELAQELCRLDDVRETGPRSPKEFGIEAEIRLIEIP